MFIVLWFCLFVVCFRSPRPDVRCGRRGSCQSLTQPPIQSALQRAHSILKAIRSALDVSCSRVLCQPHSKASVTSAGSTRVAHFEWRLFRCGRRGGPPRRRPRFRHRCRHRNILDAVVRRGRNARELFLLDTPVRSRKCRAIYLSLSLSLFSLSLSLSLVSLFLALSLYSSLLSLLLCLSFSLLSLSLSLLSVARLVTSLCPADFGPTGTGTH